MRQFFASLLPTLARPPITGLLLAVMMVSTSATLAGCAVGGTELVPVANDEADLGNQTPDLGPPEDMGVMMDPDLGPPDMGPPDMGPPDGGIPCDGMTPCCGNGVVEGGEQCDDGADDQPFDGCYACAREPACGDEGCSAVCGDGIKFPNEMCDDGNQRAGDGCSVACGFEDGYSCNVLTTDDGSRPT